MAKCIMEFERIYGIKQGNNQFNNNGSEIIFDFNPKYIQANKLTLFV